jgi:hypothetical protein
MQRCEHPPTPYQHWHGLRVPENSQDVLGRSFDQADEGKGQQYLSIYGDSPMNAKRCTCLAVVAVVAAAITASTLLAGSSRYGSDPKPEEMTLVGTVVDLHSYMTGKHSSNDEIKSTRDAIRAGVPVALETEEGLVVIGTGNKGPGRKLMPFAGREVELTGKLYEEDGFEYIDMESVEAIDDDGDDDERPRGRPERDEQEADEVEEEEDG